MDNQIGLTMDAIRPHQANRTRQTLQNHKRTPREQTATQNTPSETPKNTKNSPNNPPKNYKINPRHHLQNWSLNKSTKAKMTASTCSSRWR